MTPDTLDYMIAGYIVIAVGIAAYLLSLIIRSGKVKRKLNEKSRETKQ
jgi:CcmD family protein